MEARKISYDDYTDFSGESELTLGEGIDLFNSLNWKNDGSFYILEFRGSFIQFFTENKDETIKVEIMLDENQMKIATKIVTQQEAIKLIEYYYENDEIYLDASYKEEYI